MLASRPPRPRTSLLLTCAILAAGLFLPDVQVAAADNLPPQVSVPSYLDAFEDIAWPLAGISVSDPDAGDSVIRLVLEVGSGSLSGDVAPGIVLSGNGTSRLTIDAPQAAINGLFPSGAISFLTEPDNDSPVPLRVEVDDLGNSGSGGPLSSRAETTIAVVPVNDPPQLSISLAPEPFPATTASLTGISVFDVDAAGQPVQLTVKSSGGTLSGSVDSSVGVLGSGTATLVLTGTQSALNAYIAAGRLLLSPPAQPPATVELVFTADDLGNSGAEGPTQTSASAVLALGSGIGTGPGNSGPQAASTGPTPAAGSGGPSGSDNGDDTDPATGTDARLSIAG